VSSGWRFALGLVGVLVVSVVLIGNPDDHDPGDPLAPDARGPAGAKAMVLLLEELGADVATGVTVPGDDVDRAVLLLDDLDDERRADLLEWVEGGGTLVVADPVSPLTPPIAGETGVLGFSDVDVDRGTCDVDELAEVERISPGGAVLYDVAEAAGSCFGDDRQAFVEAGPRGAGRIVAVGGPGPFVNDRLDEADNAVLVAQLLAPEPEGASVAFLDPTAGRRPGGGDESLVDLVPRRLLFALLQLAIAFLAYVWFRARRAGRPVLEPLPSTLAGSELVAAVGELRQQEKAPERSAVVLRDDLHRTLAQRLGIPPDAPVDDLLAAAERAGADPDRLRAVLAGPPVTDGDGLTALARDIDLTRQEVLHEQH
jgi:hypothetical protein